LDTFLDSTASLYSYEDVSPTPLEQSQSAENTEPELIGLHLLCFCLRKVDL